MLNAIQHCQVARSGFCSDNTIGVRRCAAVCRAVVGEFEEIVEIDAAIRSSVVLGCRASEQRAVISCVCLANGRNVLVRLGLLRLRSAQHTTSIHAAPIVPTTDELGAQVWQAKCGAAVANALRGPNHAKQV